jgi:hypothetical protein
MPETLPPFEAELWLWKGQAPAAWVFLTLPEALATEVKIASLLAPRGWGSVRVEAESEGVRWRTSLFPDRKSESYFLPVKAAVRKQLGVDVGEPITVTLTLVDQPMF